MQQERRRDAGTMSTHYSYGTYRLHTYSKYWNTTRVNVGINVNHLFPVHTMVKALSFKGDKKVHKKRKREKTEGDGDEQEQQKQSALPSDAAPTDEEHWVSADKVDDVAGPVMLVLSSSKPASCVAVDQLGKVFSSAVENMVENEAHTAEPHDIRQVWISAKIAGSSDRFTFKGHHGRYLTSDQYGILSSTKEAVSPEETFTLALAQDSPGHFTIQTTRKTYLALDDTSTPPTIRGDSDAADEPTNIRIRMQARFKPQHKVEQAEKVRAKISRKELEAEVGRRLEDDEVKKLKRARREGDFHEVMLDVKIKGKHDKFA